MYNEFFKLPVGILSSVYGCGAYGNGTYNNSCSPSPSPTPTPTPTSTPATPPVVSIVSIDNTPYTLGSIEDVNSLPTISGLAPANSTIVITITPGDTTCTTKADAQGNWSCKITQPLTNGLHTVGVVATTPSGQVITLASFQINVSANVTTNTSTTQSTPKPVHHTNYLEISFIILILGLLIGFLIFFLSKRRKKKDDDSQHPSGPTIIPDAPTGIPPAPPSSYPPTPPTITPSS